MQTFDGFLYKETLSKMKEGNFHFFVDDLSKIT